MDKYNYDEVVKELIVKGIISGNDVYDYSLYQYPIIFDRQLRFKATNNNQFMPRRDKLKYKSPCESK